MFSRRRRAASNPPQRSAPPPSASASLAATKAFVRNQTSDVNLSNAAAAAALRSHTSSPTPVGEIVTKRMVRRGSTSSQGSQRPQGLHRQSSSGSMTERSFRNPSPNGSNAAVPPVPAVPQNIPGSGGSVHRRASSLEPVYRGASPTQRGGGRGVSLDRGSGPSVNRVQRVGSPLAQVSEEGHDQRHSVNFSRPMSPALTGGPSTSSGWFGGPVVNQEAVQRMASTTSRPQSAGNAYANNNTAQAVRNAANRPVSHHYVQQGQEGMRLSSGSMRAKPSGTAVQSRSFLPARTQSPRPVDPKSPDAVYDPSTRTFIHKQDAMNIHREQHDQPDEPAQHYVSQHLQSAAPLQSGRGRTPSPLRYSVQPEQSPPRSVAQPLLPKINTTETQRFEDRPVTPPSSQPSSGVTLARQQSEDYANADIKPVNFVPIDIGQANTSQQPETELSPQFAPNQDSSYPHIGTPANTTSNAPVEQVRDTVKNERQASLSPARHATFAPNTSVFAGLKHEPLPRSVSPAKSALKSSPSVSRRSNSPLGPNGRVHSKTASVSGASDTASESGYGKKKKKSVRVSFEQEPTIAGHAAYGDMDTPVSPAGPTPSKPISVVEDEFEDYMKPRPALPSFGSVRDKTRQRDEEDVPQKVTETVSTPMSASLASIGESVEASTDLGLGHIVAQDFASKQTATSDPLPAQLTPVEGSGYVSDSNYSTDGESSIRKHADPVTMSQSLPVPEPKSLTEPIIETPSTLPAISEQVVDVPNIAVHPATPSEHSEPKFQSMTAPGAWIEQEEQQPVASTYAPVQFAPIETPASMQQQLNEAPSTPNPDDDDTDNSSVYSDAYEDISDMDGGFGSINAIVESPVIGSSPVVGSSPGLMASKWADKSVTESPTPQSKGDTSLMDKDKPVDTSASDWEAARAHWSGINRPRDHVDAHVAQTSTHAQSVAARVLQAPVQEAELRTEHISAVQAIPKASTESAPRVSVSDTLPRASNTPQPSQTPNRPLKSALKKTTPSPAPAQASGSGVPQMRTSMRGPSMRDATSGQSQMRTTMRGNTSPGPRAATQMRTSMRGDAAPATNMALAASRQSAPVDTKAPRGALQKKHIPTAVAASQARPQSIPAVPKKVMAAPAPTYDSDSDASASSFQRSRARRNNGGGFSRTSMRGAGASPTMRASAPAPAQVRSISPPKPAQSNFRQSMRPSSPEPVKSSKFSIRSLSPAGRFRKKPKDEPPVPAMPSPKSMPKPKSKAPAPAKASTFKSRFADSSDEDEDRPRRFASRFADSDSEPEAYELPPGLAPVRGIPRKAGEEDGDSTDLEEELEATRPSTTAAPTAAVTNGHTNGTLAAQGTALAAGSLRDSKHAPSSPTTKEKRGFFGMGKKKKVAAAPASVQAQRAEAPQPTLPSSDIPLPPQTRNREVGGPLTPIGEGEDDDKQLGVSPVNTASPQVKQSPRSPKLQRRSTPEWPLAPPPPITGEQRPMSSDGVARRPRFGKRQSSQFSTNTTATSPVLDAQGRSVSFGRTGKKKKFQGLRRVFGIND